MNIPPPSETIFHTIEIAIKEYRKFALRNISEKIKDITIDQSMVLLFLDKYPDLPMHEIAKLVFKDNTSMARIVDIMIEKDLLKRTIDNENRTPFEITEKGKDVLKILPSLINQNRKSSLRGISQSEINQVENTLLKMIANCKKVGVPCW